MIQHKNIDDLWLSELALGCGKFVKLDDDAANALTLDAIAHGINVFDAHNRYGNAEKILNRYTNVKRMTKVSAYQYPEHWQYMFGSLATLHRIDIFWISDLDNDELYDKGKKMWADIAPHFSHIGITTEAPELAMRFMDEVPECRFFMLPVCIEQYTDVYTFVQEAHRRGKFVFSIKSFLDGLALKKYSIKNCLEYLKSVSLDVMIVGTSNKQHLTEICEVYEKLNDTETHATRDSSLSKGQGID